MINHFKDDYAFLSNFYAAPVKCWGIVFPTSEHAFQAGKAVDRNDMIWIAESSTPGVAKRRGRQVNLRQDWESAKIGVMLHVVTEKFSDSNLAEKLKATDIQELVEGNYWHDNFWGDCFCRSDACGNTGYNYLGRILMHVRKELKAD